MNTNTQFYETMLKGNICEAIVNINGGLQTINCTLQDALIPKPAIAKHVHDNRITDSLCVFDVLKKVWTVFRISQIQSFKLLTGSLADINPVASRPAKSQYAQFQNTQSTIPTAVMQNYADKRLEYVTALKQGSHFIKFVKADGSIREMIGTLEVGVIDSLGLLPSVSAPVHDNGTIKVVDLGINEWRTFKVDKVLEFKPTNTITPIITNPAVTGKRDEYVAKLQQGPCVVVFTKADGSERTMNATLESTKIDSLGLAPTSGVSGQPDKDSDTIRVVDLDIPAWRAFRVSNVISFKSSTEQTKRRTTLNPTV